MHNDIISCVLNALLACTEETQTLHPWSPTTLATHARTVGLADVYPIKGICFPLLDVLLQLYEKMQSFFWSRNVFYMSSATKGCQTLVAHVALTNTGAFLCAASGLANVK